MYLHKTTTNAAPVSIKKEKMQPFAAHFTTKLRGVNSKLVCNLSLPSDYCLESETCESEEYGTCTDD